MNNNLRPSEIASESEINRARERDESLKGGFKTAAKIGGAVSGAGLSARILPFLSEYITPDLAIKGISKISPDLGKFLKSGMQKGLNIKEGLNFIKDNLKQPEEKKEHPKQSLNIIEQESPELHRFISDEVTKGRQPIEAGALAQAQVKFKKIINKLIKDHKTTFQAILDTVYGGGQYGGAVNPQSQGQHQPQQAGPGQQALMTILQKIQQQRGAK